MTPAEFQVNLSQNDSWSMHRLHFHDHPELLLPLTSSGSIFVNDLVYPLQRGCLYLIGENALHRTIVNGFHSRFVLHISRKTLSALSTPQTDLLRFFSSPFHCVQMDPEQTEQAIRLFGALNDTHNDGAFGSAVRCTIRLLELLLHLVPLLDLAGSSELLHSKDFMRIAPILDYIRDNLTEPLTLDQIASRFFISKHYLCRIFKSATGFSVMEYIIHNRVLRARQLLQEGMSVQQAGELSGFSDNSHFIRTFGSITGTSPGRYAKEYKTGDRVRIREK